MKGLQQATPASDVVWQNGAWSPCLREVCAAGRGEGAVQPCGAHDQNAFTFAHLAWPLAYHAPFPPLDCFLCASFFFTVSVDSRNCLPLFWKETFKWGWVEGSVDDLSPRSDMGQHFFGVKPLRAQGLTKMLVVCLCSEKLLEHILMEM